MSLFGSSSSTKQSDNRIAAEQQDGSIVAGGKAQVASARDEAIVAYGKGNTINVVNSDAEVIREALKTSGQVTERAINANSKVLDSGFKFADNTVSKLIEQSTLAIEGGNRASYDAMTMLTKDREAGRETADEKLAQILSKNQQVTVIAVVGIGLVALFFSFSKK